MALEYRAKAADFGTFLDRNVGMVGYLIGTRGQICTQAMIDYRLASVSYQSYWYAIKRYAAKWIGKVVADCMGVYEMFLSGGEWDKPLTKWVYSDVNTGGVYALALSEALPHGSISSLPKDLPYPVAVGYTGHVGFFYKGLVYQSSGHAYGLEKTELTSTFHNKPWEFWYMIPWLDYSASSGGGEPMIICQKQAGFNENAKAMHIGLARLGYDINLLYAGQYGSATSIQVAKFQADNGLPVNGDIWDDKCNAVMVIKLAELPASTGITQEMLDAEIAKVANLTSQVDAEKAKTTAALRQLAVSQTQLTDSQNQLLIANNKLDGVRKARDFINAV